MIFYVLGTDAYTKLLSASNNRFSSNNLEEAFEKYKQYCLENRWEHCYLVVDFGLSSKSKIFSTNTSLNVNSDHIPFFVIGEYHSLSKDKSIIRKDSCVVKHCTGFEHEFVDNLSAIREFLYFFEKDIDVKFSIVYHKEVEKGSVISIDSKYVIDSIFERKIADTKTLSSLSKPRYVKKFNLDMSGWTPLPLSERRFAMFKVGSESEDKEKENLVVSCM